YRQLLHGCDELFSAQVEILKSETQRSRKMNIGIIGAGNIGGNLTRRFRGLGHRVFVANSRGPESLADLAAETGATPVSVHEAAQAGEVVIVTIPQKSIPTLPRDLFAGVPENVVVI